MKVRILLACAGAAVVSAACDAGSPAESAPVGSARGSLSAGAARVLGFEDPLGDWTSSSGTLSSSDARSQGEHSLGVVTPGWTEVVSAPLSTLGPVGPALSYDIMLPEAVSWGETRVIVRVPSQGVQWADLGGRPLSGLAPDVFHRVEFPIAAALAEALALEYSDLELRIVINAPALAEPYLLDDLALGTDASEDPPAFSSFSVRVELPGTTALGQVALAGSESVHVGSQAVIGGTIANSGTGPTQIVAASATGSVLAGGDLFLGSGTTINGNVLAAGQIERQNDVSVSGTIFGDAALGVTTVAEWTVAESSEYAPGVEVEPGVSHAPPPGAYAFLRVKPQATAQLASGLYFLDAFEVSSGAVVEVNDASGPVVLYVNESLNLQGSVVTGDGEPPQLLIVYRGSAGAFVRAPFQGTVIAPEAQLTLAPFESAIFRGSFFAKHVEAQGSVTVEPHAFDLGTVGTTFGGGVNWPDAQVIQSVDGDELHARLEPDGSELVGHWSPLAPAEFTIPARLEVSQGNARTGHATLGFDEAGTSVTCSYVGGSPTSPPATALDRARGKFYNLVGCSNGAEAGDTVQGTAFVLDLDDEQPEPDVTVRLGAGNGCQHSIGYPIDPETSIEMRDAFSWAETSALPERDAQGRHNLYYANIYIETERQRRLLDDMFIHYSGKPLFVEEMAKFFGKCGAINYSGDGEGIFFFAVLPAQTYNFIREAALDPANAGDPDMFEAVILRDVPAELANADGSLSYEMLWGNGFDYVARSQAETGLDEAPGDPLLGDLVRAGADFLEDTYHEVRNAGGEVDQAISGSVNLSIYLSVLSRGQAFARGTPMRRAWGTRFGWEMPLDNLKITVEHSRAGLNIYSEFDNTNAEGIARMTVAEGTVGTGVCVDLEHPAARFEQYIQRDEVCDYRGSSLGEFDSSRRIIWQSEDWRLHSFAGIMDGYHYLRDVAGHTPPKAQVLIGDWANDISPDTDDGDAKRPWAACLGFPSLTKELARTIVNGIFPPAGVVLDVMDDFDIVLPSESSVRFSRVATHEYGHYALCSLIHSVNSERLALFLLERASEGNDESGDDENAILNEAFADFFLSQLAGSVNYFEPDPDSSIPAGNMSYCARLPGTDPRRLPCLERNPTVMEADLSCGSPTDPSCRFDQEIGHKVHIFHDAFDGHANVATANVPTDGRLWVLSPLTNTLLPSHWTDYNAPDEPVALPGASLRSWVQNWTETGISLNFDNFLRALNREMTQNGYTWCDRCRLFAPHTSTPHDAQAFGFRHALEECVNDATVAGWLENEPPPGPIETLSTACSPCPEGEAVDSSGVCHPQIIFEEDCEPGHERVDGVCTECPPGSDWFRSVCYSCPPSAPFFDYWNTRGCVESCYLYSPVDGICPAVIK